MHLFLTVYMRRMLCAVMMTFVILAALLCAPPYSRAAEQPQAEEWIFSVIMPPKWQITDTLFAYQLEGSWYLPIVSLSDAFEFYADAEIDRGYVKGFAGREDNSFIIDSESNELVIEGDARSLPEDSILRGSNVPDDDVYVRITLLNKIWPVEMEVDLSNLTIFVAAEEELAFERALKREKRLQRFENQKEQIKEEEASLPRKPNPYLWLGKPILDLQTDYTYDRQARTLNGSLRFNGVQQIGKMIADYSGTYTLDDGKVERPDIVRLKFSRAAPKGETLFVPTLKRFELGDVNFQPRPLIGNNVSGRGVLLTSEETTRSREFDRITIEGTGPPGWEIELYNNDRLIDFGVVEPDGEYRFEDVVLLAGNNQIRAILYGPQGQVREDVQQYNIARNMNKPGEFSYRAGILDQDRPLVLLDNEPRTTPRGISRNLEMSYGLNKNLTFFGSYTDTPQRNGGEKFITAGMAFGTSFGVGEIEGYNQIGGGRALDARFVTSLADLRLNLRAALFSDDFVSEEAGFGTSGKAFEAGVQAQTRLALPFMPINLNFDLDYQESKDGLRTTDLTTTQTIARSGLRLNNITRSRFLNEVHENSSGNLNTTWNRGPWQLRGGINYTMHPEWDLTNIQNEIRYRTRDSFQAALNLQHDFTNSISSIGTQLGYDFDRFLGTVDARYQQERGWQFTVRASTSLHPYTEDGHYTLTSENQRQTAPVLGRIFLDRDGDNEYSENDEPVEGARLLIGRAKSRDKSDANGVLVSSLSENQPRNLRIDEASLQDPYYKPASDGFSIVPLRGKMPGFDFPVVETGSIDGTVRRSNDDSPVTGMDIQLVDSDDNVAMTASTAYDGYYAFEFVLPGTYTVRADPKYEVNVPAETVTVSSDELFAFGIDLTLLVPAAEEEEAAHDADGESGKIAQTNHAAAAPGTLQPAPSSSGRGSAPAAKAASSIGDSYPDVKSVRIGEHPDRVRLVLDLSAPIVYDVKEGAEGLVILVDLPQANWDTIKSQRYKYNMVLKSYEVEDLPDGGTRLVLKAHERMEVQDIYPLPAEKGRESRLVIDLSRK